MKNYIILLLFIFTGCENKSQIRVKVTNLPSEKLYLIEAFSHDIIDSATKIEDNFEFNNVLKDSIDPYMVSLMFTNVNNGKKELLPIRNILLSKNGANIDISAFMVEDNSVKITGDYNHVPVGLKIEGGIQNESMLKNQNANFGYLESNQPLIRTNTVFKYKSLFKNR